MSRLTSFIIYAVCIPGVIGDCYDDPNGNSKSYNNCITCYQTLANALIDTGDNKYQLSRGFFPDNNPSPIEVEVDYVILNTTNVVTKWYWLAGEFFVIQPLDVFLYRSLFFSPPPWRKESIRLLLPESCLNDSSGMYNMEFMRFLTQRLKVYATTQGVEVEVDESYIGTSVNGDKRKSFRSVKLENNIRHGIIFAVYAIPFSLCLLVIIILIAFVCIRDDLTLFRRYGRKVKNSPRLQSNWAATVVVCVFFNIFVFCMDIVAHYHETAKSIPSYYAPESSFSIMTIAFSVIMLAMNFLGFLFLTCFSFMKYDENSFCNVIIFCFCFLWLHRIKHFCGGGNQNSLKRRSVVAYLGVIICVGSTILAISFHFQNIVIAWTVVPFYAGKIAIHHAITIGAFFLPLKYAFKGFINRYEDGSQKKEKIAFCLFSVTFVLVGVGTVATISIFIFYLPINYSIEESATGITTIYHGSVLIIGGLIAYNVGGHYIGGSFSLNTVLTKTMNDMKTNPADIMDQEWELECEEARMSKLMMNHLENQLESELHLPYFKNMLRRKLLKDGRTIHTGEFGVTNSSKDQVYTILNQLELKEPFRSHVSTAIIDASIQHFNANQLNWTSLCGIEQYISTVNSYMIIVFIGLGKFLENNQNKTAKEFLVNFVSNHSYIPGWHKLFVNIRKIPN